MILKEHLRPTPSIFSAMPQEIWEGELEPEHLDIELFTRISNLPASPLFEYYVRDGQLDYEEIARLIHNKYKNNWQRIWDATRAEYSIFLTSSVKEERIIKTDKSGTETRDLTDLTKGTNEVKRTINGTSTRTGAIRDTKDAKTTYNTTDSAKTDISDLTTESGTEALKTDRDLASTRNGTLTKSGTETTTNDLVETRDLENGNKITGTDTTTDTFNNYRESSNGSITKSGSESKAINGTESPNTTTTTELSGTDSVRHVVEGANTSSVSTTDSGKEITSTSENNSGTDATQYGKVVTDSSKNSAKNVDGLYGVGGGSGTAQPFEIIGTGAGVGLDGAQPTATSLSNSEVKDARNQASGTDQVNYGKSTEGESSLEFVDRKNVTATTETKSPEVDTTTHGKTETVTESGSTTSQSTEALSFVDRVDSTADEKTITGSQAHATAYGKNELANESGTVKNTGTTTLGFVGRTDQTSESTTDTGNTVDTTTFGKNVQVIRDEGVTATKTGSDTLADASVQSFDDLKDIRSDSETNLGTDSTEAKATGTIGNIEEGTVTETFTSEGSTPLRTYQALIQEEIDGRSGAVWNVVDIMISDVQSMIAQRVWKRVRLVEI